VVGAAGFEPIGYNRRLFNVYNTSSFNWI